ncbi:MAG TPA: hypothetical protein VMS17_30695 [Gemmataceae bacterium]|nr:hypothetical protein [Gemmataceae bacterium]
MNHALRRRLDSLETQVAAAAAPDGLAITLEQFRRLPAEAKMQFLRNRLRLRPVDATTPEQDRALQEAFGPEFRP